MHSRDVCNVLGYLALFAVCLGGFLPALKMSPRLVVSSQSPSSEEVRELMIQRRDVLKQRATTLDTMYQAGRLKLDSVLRGRDQLLEAELHLAENTEQRQAIYEQRVENMRKLEETIQARFDNGDAQYEASLAATAARLQAEINLALERQ